MECKGIIMKIVGQQVIVLTKDRQFIRLPYQETMTVGQEVMFPAVPKYYRGRRLQNSWSLLGVFVASVLLLLEFWQGIPQSKSLDPYVYVTLDLQPSIELALNDDEVVLHTRPLDENASALVHDVSLQGEKVERAASLLTQEAVKRGYLQGSDEVIITAARARGQEKDLGDLVDLESKIITAVKRSTHKQMTIAVKGIVVTRELRQAALRQGISAGRYALYVLARSQGISLSSANTTQPSRWIGMKQKDFSFPFGDHLLMNVNKREMNNRAFSQEINEIYPVTRE